MRFTYKSRTASYSTLLRILYINRTAQRERERNSLYDHGYLHHQRQLPAQAVALPLGRGCQRRLVHRGRSYGDVLLRRRAAVLRKSTLPYLSYSNMALHIVCTSHLTLPQQPTHGPGLVDVFVCNCSDCRKITASMFATGFIVKDTHLKHVRGRENLKTYGQDRTIASGHTYVCLY